MVGVFCQWMSIISFREYLKMFMKYGIERMNVVMEGNYVIIKWVKVFQKPSSWKQPTTIEKKSETRVRTNITIKLNGKFSCKISWRISQTNW